MIVAIVRVRHRNDAGALWYVRHFLFLLSGFLSCVLSGTAGSSETQKARTELCTSRFFRSWRTLVLAAKPPTCRAWELELIADPPFSYSLEAGRRAASEPSARAPGP